MIGRWPDWPRWPDLTVAAALLDQRLMAGLGNLWVNEICFLRGISPWTPVRHVDLDPLVRLAARALRHSAKVPGAFQVTTATTVGARTTGWPVALTSPAADAGP